MELIASALNLHSPPALQLQLHNKPPNDHLRFLATHPILALSISHSRNSIYIMASTAACQQVSAAGSSTQPNASLPTAATTSLQQQAIEKARSSFAKLPNQDAVFQQCVGSRDGVNGLVEALKARYDSKSKTQRSLLKKFHQYSAFLRNFSGVIEVAIQVHAGIACPVWALLKFILEVSS
jgi:hypothetical protein